MAIMPDLSSRKRGTWFSGTSAFQTQEHLFTFPYYKISS